MADELSKNLASLRIDRSSDRAKPASRGWISWLIALGGVGAAYFVVWPKLEATIFKAAVEVTEISMVSPAQAQVELTASGYVQAEVESKIAPKVPGRVLKVHVVQGQKVELGQVVLELDPADDQANIAAAQSRVRAAQAQAQSAEARVLTAEAEYREVEQRASRERKLATQGVSASALAEDLEARAQAAAEALKAARAAAKATFADAAALAAQTRVLETGLKNLTLTAPISGVVVSRPPQLGEFVGPQPAGVQVDMGGVRIADFSTLVVETDIPEARLSQVRPGGPAEIVLDAFPTERRRGRVKEITPQVDRAKATVLVKVSFVDPTQNVLPDMAARVSFLAQELDEKALAIPPKKVVPKVALRESGGGQVVFVLDGDRVKMTPVQLGPAFGNGYELVSGPSAGTKLIANPSPALSDGQKVKTEDAEN
jgi:RND family efflux transporter MFP subunit